MQVKERNGLTSALLGLFTCGIYQLFFWTECGEDVNRICEGDGKETPSYIVAFLLSLITCGIYQMYWIYSLASRLDTASKKYDVNVESPVIFTLAMNIPFLSFFYVCDVLNKFNKKYAEMYYGGGSGSRPVNPGPAPAGKDWRTELGSQVQNAASGVKKTAMDARENFDRRRAQNPNPMQPQRICKNCGTPIPDGMRYCKRCGQPADGGNPYPTPAPAPRPNPGPASNPTPAPAPKPMNQPKESSQGGLKMSGDFAGSVNNSQSPANPAPAADRCPHCGSAIKPGDRFCIHCGSKL